MFRRHRVTVVLLLVFSLFLPSFQNLSTASDLPENLSHRAEIIHFKNQLNQNFTHAENLKKRLKETFVTAARPQTEYLLYQNSLGITGLSSALMQLKEDRKRIVRKITHLEEKPLSASLLPGLENFSSTRFYPTYSGAPLLAFNTLQHSNTGSPLLTPFGAGLAQTLTIVFFLLIFSLPLIAIYKNRQQYTKKEIVRVFPIFTIQTDKGHRDIFKMAA